MIVNVRRCLTSATLGFLLLGACREDRRETSRQAAPSPQSMAPPMAEAAPVKVWVTADGDIELDGVTATLADVERAFELAAGTGAAVFYGRDSASDEPHPNGMKIIELVTRHRLSIRLSTKRDFSDAVAPEEAVLVHLDMAGLPMEVYEAHDLATLEDRLIEAIEGEGLGEFDGNEVGQGQATLFMYGPDAERLFAGVETILREYPLCRGARVEIRRGSPGAPAREVRIQ